MNTKLAIILIACLPNSILNANPKPSNDGTLDDRKFLELTTVASDLRNSGEYLKSEQAYRSLLTEDLGQDHRAETLLGLGTILIFREAYDLATIELLKILDLGNEKTSTNNELDNHKHEASSFLAHCYAAQGDLPDALKYAEIVKKNYLLHSVDKGDVDLSPEGYDTWVDALHEIAKKAQIAANKPTLNNP